VSPGDLTDERGGRSQIIRPGESLALYKLFNTLWAPPPSKSAPTEILSFFH
jgi:hypothetical protein